MSAIILTGATTTEARSAAEPARSRARFISPSRNEICPLKNEESKKPMIAISEA